MLRNQNGILNIFAIRMISLEYCSALILIDTSTATLPQIARGILHAISICYASWSPTSTSCVLVLMAPSGKINLYTLTNGSESDLNSLVCGAIICLLLIACHIHINIPVLSNKNTYVACSCLLVPFICHTLRILRSNQTTTIALLDYSTARGKMQLLGA